MALGSFLSVKLDGLPIQSDESSQGVPAMNTLADALVYAVVYINYREDPDEKLIDEDVGALESIACCLASASDEEKNSLAAAAKRALAEEQSGSNRQSFIEDLSTWMEDMFGEVWVGNDRATY
jgi:hypothetical protein